MFHYVFYDCALANSGDGCSSEVLSEGLTTSIAGHQVRRHTGAPLDEYIRH